MIHNDSMIHDTLHAVTAEFIEGPLRVHEFTLRVTKASIDLRIDCQEKPVSLLIMLASVK